MRVIILIPLILLIGCQKGYDGVREVYLDAMNAAWDSTATISNDPYERIELLPSTNGYVVGTELRNRILESSPSIRSYNDSLARYDSVTYAYFHMERIRDYYYYADTAAAVFSYFDAMPWLRVYGPKIEASQAKRFAENVGEALGITKSPRMATMAYEAFQRAEVLALDLDDYELQTQIDSSRDALLSNLVTMPDSVRRAFRPGTSLGGPVYGWQLGVVAMVLFLFGSGSLGVYRWRKQHPQNILRADFAGSTSSILDALWLIIYKPDTVPNEVRHLMNKLCRQSTNQRAMFMAAGLMVLTTERTDEAATRVANTVRSRLLRHFKKQDWAFGPGVLLPRDRDEWAQWFASNPVQKSVAKRKQSARFWDHLPFNRKSPVS